LCHFLGSVLPQRSLFYARTDVQPLQRYTQQSTDTHSHAHTLTHTHAHTYTHTHNHAAHRALVRQVCLKFAPCFFVHAAVGTQQPIILRASVKVGNTSKECVSECVFACVCVRVCACVCACERVCVCVFAQS